MLATVNPAVQAALAAEPPQAGRYGKEASMAGRTGGARRAEILRAAAGLFAARGSHGVSIDDLGRAVGTSGPALYRHFPGKEALLAAMLLDVSERLAADGAERAAAHADDPHRALDRKSTRLNSSHVAISYAVFCLKKKRE